MESDFVLGRRLYVRLPRVGGVLVRGTRAPGVAAKGYGLGLCRCFAFVSTGFAVCCVTVMLYRLPSAAGG